MFFKELETKVCQVSCLISFLQVPLHPYLSFTISLIVLRIRKSNFVILYLKTSITLVSYSLQTQQTLYTLCPSHANVYRSLNPNLNDSRPYSCLCTCPASRVHLHLPIWKTSTPFSKPRFNTCSRGKLSPSRSWSFLLKKLCS